ncbi:MAG: aspartyl protease [Candidatus Bathyarchaeia archaeon]
MLNGQAVGFVKVRFRIINPVDREKYLDVEGVVNTGAIYTVVGRALLESIGLKSVEKRKFREFGGEVEREIGIAEVELMGRKGGITLIFGEKDDTAILGVTALEALGLEVDPIRNTLKEAQLLMLIEE